MVHYKSWSNLNRQLHETLCDELKLRITYFLTHYHDTHNSYGRAAIRLDGEEKAIFSWIKMYNQECDISQLHCSDSKASYEELAAKLKYTWDENCTYYERDFLKAALKFRNMSIVQALSSESYIIKIFAIMDKRIGKRTLMKIADLKAYDKYPEWVKQFYKLRLSVSGLQG